MENQSSIVIADDDPDLLSLMTMALSAEGYAVRGAANGQEALELVGEETPDIVVIDLWMPIKDGFSVVRELKADPAYHHLPVVLLSAAGQTDNKIQGLDLGADDFLTKPLEIPELLARIRMILKRNKRGLDANPLTHLPGNVSIQARINQALAAKGPVAVLYVDIDHFKAYNDAYGYDAGDRVLQDTGRMLLESAKANGGKEPFIGHIGGDDFIILTSPAEMEDLCVDIIARFDSAVPGFYKEKDVKQGKIISVDRQGKTVEFPLISISIGACHNRERELNSYAQVSQIGAELKRFAKRQPGSHYVLDRRKD